MFFSTHKIENNAVMFIKICTLNDYKNKNNYLTLNFPYYLVQLMVNLVSNYRVFFTEPKKCYLHKIR